MVNIKNTLDELKAIINDLKTSAVSTTALAGQDLTDLEKRIDHLLDKSKPKHTNLSADLDIDLKDLENIDKTIGQEKLKTDAEIKKLTDEKKQLETNITAKDALIKQKDEEIGGKITSGLINSLDNLVKGGLKKPKLKADGTEEKDANGNTIYEDVIDTAKINEIKTIVDELKTKGAKADLSSLDNKFKEIKDEVGKIPSGEKGTNYWSVGAAVGTGISVLLLGYLAFLKPSVSPKYISKDDDSSE